MRKVHTVLGSIIALIIASCTGETVDYTIPNINSPLDSGEIPVITPPSEASAPLGSILPETIENSNEFAIKFYLANSKGTDMNVCVSPFSVGSVLGMIANGDDGLSRNYILNALGFEKSSEGIQALNTYYQTFISNLPNIEESIICNVTNTIWCDPRKYTIRENFMQIMMKYYYACKIEQNPGGEEGKDAVNLFVSRNTNGLIDEFLSSPLSIDMAFLNTIYFKAGWSTGFIKDMTREETFTDFENKVQKTDFMLNYSNIDYAKTADGIEAIRLNYGKNGNFSMTLILPGVQIGNDAIEDILTPDNIEQINKNLKKQLMILKLPKFEIETNNPNMIDILKKIGLDKISTQSFGLISETNDFYLKYFIHAVKIKVDEDGTEGAAASVGRFDVTEDNTNAIKEIVFNRPFMFYINENTTGAILFIGSVKTFR